MDQTQRASPTVSLIVTSVNALSETTEWIEAEGHSRITKLSLSACDTELSCDSQAGLIVWLQMGIPDKLHGLEEQMGSKGMAAAFTKI